MSQMADKMEGACPSWEPRPFHMIPYKACCADNL